MEKRKFNRRESIKIIGAGSLGGALAGAGFACTGKTGMNESGSIVMPPNRKLEETATVSLAKGDDRREIIRRSMENIGEDILRSIGKKRVLIKPNCVSHSIPTACTDPDAIRGVMDFLAPHVKEPVIVGESTASRTATTLDIFEEYGYMPIKDEFDVEFLDLNMEPTEHRNILGANNTVVPIRIIKQFLDPDIFIISLPRMKVHGNCYVTLSLKNVLLGAPVCEYKEPEKGWKYGDKFAMHITGEPSATDPLFFNMFLLAHHVWPDLAVIDGFQGMEKFGPARGPMIDSRVAVTSLDPLAADVTGTRVMGLKPEILPVFNYLNESGFGQGDPDKIEIVGNTFEECLCPYENMTSEMFEANT